jgi:predicted lipoprotein with Yx(FWY)xxD motif
MQPSIAPDTLRAGRAPHGAPGHTTARGRPARRVLGLGGALLLGGVLAAACGSSSSTASSKATSTKASTPASSSAASTPTVEALRTSDGTVLATPSGQTLYLLTSEAGGAIKCTGSCLSIWHPLTLPSGMSAPVAGKGVAGTLGVVHRTNGEVQVTDNGYPLYTFVEDTGPGQTKGEGIHFPGGGVWYLVSASATSASASPVTGPSSSSATSSAQSAPSYGGGY